MEDSTAVDAALDSGYYQLTAEAWQWVVLIVGVIVLVQWALSTKQN